MKFFKKKKKTRGTLDPDEIFLDSSNLPEFDKNLFEGRIEHPISKQTLTFLILLIFLAGFFLIGRLWTLQIENGGIYSEQSKENRLNLSPLFAERGVIYDRNGIELAWNVPNDNGRHALRVYTENDGFGHLLGYVKLPQQDKEGNYYNIYTTGLAGAELAFDGVLEGKNGEEIIETDVYGELRSASVSTKPIDGDNINLSIDSRLQVAFHGFIKDLADSVSYEGGAGIIMDIYTGEVVALTSYPEYNPNIVSSGKEGKKIAQYVSNSRKPFLDRTTSGLYTPGSIVKLFVALGALGEGVINPNKSILSTGEIRIQNPYNPELFSTFLDWKAHGYVNMRQAIAVSSNVYFYSVGGGFEDQKGIGIDKIGEYVKKFGIGDKTGIEFPEKEGIVPNPKWKGSTFVDGTWRLGDTYNTAIGQYGFQVTPIQIARAVGAIANGGTLLTPTTLKNSNLKKTLIKVKDEHFRIVQEGMKLAVKEGTARGLSNPWVEVAAKTGTAQIGARNEFSNSWVTGYFPADNPKYSFVVLMDRAPAGTGSGGVFVMSQMFRWMNENTPEYFVIND